MTAVPSFELEGDRPSKDSGSEAGFIDENVNDEVMVKEVAPFQRDREQGAVVQTGGNIQKEVLVAQAAARAASLPARTRWPGMAPVCVPRSKMGVPATRVAS